MGNKPKAKRKTTTRKRPARVLTPEQQQQQQRPATQWLKIAAWVGGTIVAIVLLFFAFGDLGPTEEPEGIVDYFGLSRDHTDQAVAYEQDPPAGGPHAPIWLNCGYYDVPVPNENAVHSLEHGSVWITYRPDLTEGQIDDLIDLAQQPKVLVSPYPGLTDDVVASVWGRQLRLAEFDAGIVKDFIITQKDGPTTPEPGAVCTGGVGVPSA